MRVAVIMGSTSDLPKVEPAIKILKDYGVQVDVRCLSAHRAHAGLSAFIEEANGNGTEVFITAAGMAAPAGRPGCPRPRKRRHTAVRHPRKRSAAGFAGQSSHADAPGVCRCGRPHSGRRCIRQCRRTACR